MIETYQIKNCRDTNSWFLPSKSRFTMESTVLGKRAKSLEGIRVITQIDTLIPTNQIQNVSKQNCHGTRPIGVQKRKIPKSPGNNFGDSWIFVIIPSERVFQWIFQGGLASDSKSNKSWKIFANLVPARLTASRWSWASNWLSDPISIF